MAHPKTWQPRIIRRLVAVKPTGTRVAEVVTDHGPAFVKFLGNPEGPHVLAAEYLGTRLAGALGLPILDWHVFTYDGVPEVHLGTGQAAKAGSAWCTRKEEGFEWSGESTDLEAVCNVDDIAKLVLLDQWTLNCDRYRPAPRFRQNLHNVFFSRENTPPGKLRLLALDHTHILTCGAPFRLDMANIDRVRDPAAYGLFPGFQPVIRREHALAAVGSLSAIELEEIRAIVAEIPQDWEVSTGLREVLVNFLRDRRNWLVTHFVNSLFPQQELF